MEHKNIAGLTHVIEHGFLTARRGRAICTYIRGDETITHLQLKQDAANERFWRMAPDHHIFELIISRAVPTTLMCAKALQLAVDRDLESIAAALLYSRYGNLAPASAADKATLQALFDRAVEEVGLEPRALRTARMLLARYRSINPSVHNNTAFVCLSKNGDAPMVRLLLADPRVNPCAQSHAALQWASSRGHVEVVQAIVADARVNPRAGGNAAVLAARGDGVNARDWVGQTPLHVAAWCGRKDVVQVLLAAGAEVNALAGAGKTPLHNATLCGHTDVVRLLLAGGANVNAKDRDGKTPLTCASKLSWHKDVVKMLLANGADSDAKDDSGQKPGLASLTAEQAQRTQAIGADEKARAADSRSQQPNLGPVVAEQAPVPHATAAVTTAPDNALDDDTAPRSRCGDVCEIIWLVLALQALILLVLMLLSGIYFVVDAAGSPPLQPCEKVVQPLD